MPAPEQLGVSAGWKGSLASAGEKVDWNTVLDKVNRLGSIGFHLTRLPQGGCQVTLLLPTGQTDRIQHIEASAATEADAVRLALERAEQWGAARR
jgi:hypothetical protein